MKLYFIFLDKNFQTPEGHDQFTKVSESANDLKDKKVMVKINALKDVRNGIAPRSLFVTALNERHLRRKVFAIKRELMADKLEFLAEYYKDGIIEDMTHKVGIKHFMMDGMGALRVVTEENEVFCATMNQILEAGDNYKFQSVFGQIYVDISDLNK